jgi:uncharacterized protein YqhQ
MPVLESGEEILVGGQAVMEGVMMRAPHSYCVAVRKKSGEIATTQMPLPRISETYPIFKYPILRGIGTMYQALSLGMKALRFSGDVVAEDLKKEEECSGKVAKEMPSWVMAVNLIFSVAFFIFLYIYVPLYLAARLQGLYSVLGGRIAFNLTSGLIHTAIFVLFMLALSFTKDFRRIFEFHGAEHKVVFNYESGQPVNVANAQSFVTFHPRCGTSFLFVVIFVSVACYTFIPFDALLPKFLCRIAFMPLITGVSYEIIRFAAKHRGSVLSLLTAPGLWMQRITTKPPTDEQTAVAIRALEGAMELEKQQGGELVIA